MAVEEIISKYILESQGYISELEKIQREVKETGEIEKKQSTESKKTALTLQQAAAQRNKLLKEENATLKQLQAQRKLSFNTKEIEAYNTKIAASKRNIDLLKGSTGELNSINAQLRNSFAGLGAGIAAAFSARAIVQFAQDSVRSFREAEVSANQLKFAVQSIGGEGEVAFQKLIDQSQRLQNITVFSDESIQGAQRQLIQFGLLADEVDSLIPKIVDLASASGKTLSEATDLVIQGINGQTRALKPLGLEFKNTGDKAENLAIVTEKLNKFTGASAELLETSAGKAANLANRFDDLKEKLGEIIVSSGLFQGVTKAFDAFISSFRSLEDLRKDNVLTDVISAQNIINAGISSEIELRKKQAGVEITTAETIKKLQDDILAKEKQLTEDRNARLKNAIALTDEELNAGIARERSKEKEIDADKKLLEIEKQKKIVQNTAVKTVDGKAVITPEIESQIRLNALKKEQIRIENSIKDAGASKEILRARQVELLAVEQLIDAEERRGKSNLGLTADEQAKREADAVTEANKAREDEIKLREKINELRAKGIQDPVKSLESQAKAEIEKELAQSKATEETKAEFIQARTLALAAAIYKIKTDANKKLSDDEIANLEKAANAQDEIFREQLEKRRQQEIDAQKRANQARIDSFKDGSLGQLNEQKTIAKELYDEQLKNNKIISKSTDELNDKNAASFKEYTDKVEDYDDDITAKRIQNLKDVAAVTTAVFDSIVQLSNARSQRVIENLQKEGDAQIEVYDKDLEALETQRDKKLISESTFETRSAEIKQKRVEAEKRVEEAIAKEKRKAAELAKIFAIFQATLAIAIALAYENFVGAAVAAAELAVIIATPIPTFKKGTKGAEKTATSLVGEEGPELRVVHRGDKIVPAKQTKKYREAADAMIDDNFEEWIHKTYVLPFVRMEEKKKQKGSFENVIPNAKLMRSILNEEKNLYNFSIHKDYINPSIERAQKKQVINQQKSFAENIANSIVHNTTIVNKVVDKSANEIERFRKSKEKINIGNVEQIGKSIARHLNEYNDNRHL